MGKLIFLSDTHFHNWKEFSRPDDKHVNSRLGEQIKVLEEVFEIAREEKADIVFAGDLFHKRQSVDTRVFNSVYESFANNSDVKVYAIPGNHDKVTNSLQSESSIDVFKYIDNFELSTTIEQVHIGDVVLTMVPYGDEVEEIKESLDSFEVDETKTNILVAHLGVSGSLTGKGGHRLEGAFTYQDLNPEKFEYIMLGHYHKPQTLQGNKNHMYVGTMMQNNFGEEGLDTGVVLVDTELKKIERIEIPSTKFVTVDGSDIPDNIEEIIKESYVRFTGDRGQVRALENVVEDTSNIRVSINEQREVETRIDIDNDMSPESITSKYMEEYYPEAEKEAIECLREAITDAKV